ncbi:MAG: hypothetical protein M1352_02555 [Patescibacteria group bacterium]|nr:hypothetical protein [Patescibacteria group bacterium]
MKPGELFLKLIPKIGLIIAIPLIIYFWGAAIVYNIANFWKIFTPSNTVTLSQSTDNPVLPPHIQPLPPAVKDPKIAVSGYAQEGVEVRIYVNGSLEASVRADKGGQFSFDSINLKEGDNQIYAKAVDSQRNESSPSQTITVSYIKKPPFLDVNNLGSDVNDVKQASNVFNLVGKSDPQATITVNGFQVFVDPDGNFSYPLTLNKGQNQITIQATDTAGNTTTIKKIINFTQQQQS